MAYGSGVKVYYNHPLQTEVRGPSRYGHLKACCEKLNLDDSPEGPFFLQGMMIKSLFEGKPK